LKGGDQSKSGLDWLMKGGLGDWLFEQLHTPGEAERGGPSSSSSLREQMNRYDSMLTPKPAPPWTGPPWKPSLPLPSRPQSNDTRR
jgi:hypothetical protein